MKAVLSPQETHTSINTHVLIILNEFNKYFMESV